MTTKRNQEPELSAPKHPAAGAPRPPRQRTAFRVAPRIAVASACLVLGLLSTAVLRPRPLFVWNASPSSAIGLYRVRAHFRLLEGHILVAFAPTPARRLAASRGYLPYGVPLVKPIAAVPGDRVCALGADIFINGELAARRLRRDLEGRRLPWWYGCKLLRGGELFLLSKHVPRAFDGRYFGISREAEVVGEAELLFSRSPGP